MRGVNIINEEETRDLFNPLHTNDLTYCDDGDILSHLQVRSKNGYFFTYIYPIVIYLSPNHAKTHPFDRVSLTSYQELSELERKGCPYYAVYEAINKISTSTSVKDNQAIVLLGETSSGKSTLYSALLEAGNMYIFEMNGSNDESTTLLHSADYIINSFTTAKVQHSKCSTRCTKAVKFKLKKKKFLGCEFSISLLEKQRVVSQESSDSSFLIFHMILAGATLNSLHLKVDPMEEFRYLYIREDSDDFEVLHALKERINHLTSCLASIGLTTSEIEDIFNILCLILHLGNLTFQIKGEESSDNPEEAEIVSCQHFQIVKEIVQIDNFERYLTSKVLTGVGRDSVYYKGLTIAQATKLVDVLAIDLYDKLVSWLLAKCNKTTTPASKASPEGVLTMHLVDLVGFDFSDINKFQRLMNNYLNEKIQLIFSMEYIQSEIDYLLNEGCKLTLPSFSSNILCVNLIEGENGLLRLIDEYCLLSRTNQDDSALLSMFSSYHQKHAHFITGKTLRSLGIKEGEASKFAIKHYMGSIVYDVSGFSSSNLERLEHEMENILKSSDNLLISAVYSMMHEGEEKELVSSQSKFHSRRSSSKRSRVTNSSKARTQVNTLVNEIQQGHKRYIRCFRQNIDVTSSEFDTSYVDKTFKYSGIYDLLTLNRECFMYRYDWKSMLNLLFQEHCCHAAKLKFPPTTLTDISNRDAASVSRLVLNKMNFNSEWFESESGIVHFNHRLHEMLRNWSLCQLKQLIVKNYRHLMIPHRLVLLSKRIGVIKTVLIMLCRRLRARKFRAQERVKHMRIYHVIMRWRYHLRMAKRNAVRPLLWFLKRISWKKSIIHLVTARKTISNFVHTRLQHHKYFQMKKASLCVQTKWRSYHCRQVHMDTLNQVRINLRNNLYRLCATKIYSVYRNKMLRLWLHEAFCAVRWNDHELLWELLHPLDAFRDQKRRRSGDDSQLANRFYLCLADLDLVDYRDPLTGYATMLHLAVEGRQTRIVEVLMKSGANPLLKDAEGCSIFDSLVESGTKEIIDATILATVLRYFPDIITELYFEGFTLSDFREYFSSKLLCNVQCGVDTLERVIREGFKKSQRSNLKQRHVESLQAGPTINPIKTFEELLIESGLSIPKCYLQPTEKYACAPSEPDYSSYNEPLYLDPESDEESHMCGNDDTSTALSATIDNEMFDPQVTEYVRNIIFKSSISIKDNEELYYAATRERKLTSENLQMNDDYYKSQGNPTTSNLYQTPASSPMKTKSIVSSKGDKTRSPAKRNKEPVKSPAPKDTSPRSAIKDDAIVRKVNARHAEWKKEPILQLFDETRFSKTPAKAKVKIK